MRPLPGIPSPRQAVSGERGIMSAYWFRFLENLVFVLGLELPVKGTATFSAGTSVAVTFDTALSDANYAVVFDGEENNTFWPSSKTASGFTANADTSTSATVRWVLHRD